MMRTREDLERIIKVKWRRYCAADPNRIAHCVFNTGYKDWEAEYFMRGLERDLFSIVAPCSCKNTPSCHLHYKPLGDEVRKNFFDRLGVGAGREAVTQFAAIMQ